jgi:hypothetical protein
MVKLSENDKLALLLIAEIKQYGKIGFKIEYKEGRNDSGTLR